MHVTVTDGCISCGLCADEFPELFHLNDEGVAEAVPSTVAADQEEAARQAANDCPVGVIVISECSQPPHRFVQKKRCGGYFCPF